jgi:hypothetical protein
MNSNTNIITLQRTQKGSDCTIGRLDVFGDVVWTLEDQKREHKVYGETRIPAGFYSLKLRKEGGMNARYSAKFGVFHCGMIWLQDVPMFEYVYIHVGNTARDTEGCILVGLGLDTDKIVRSKDAYTRIYPPIVKAIDSAQGCFIDVRDEE